MEATTAKYDLGSGRIHSRKVRSNVWLWGIILIFSTFNGAIRKWGTSSSVISNAFLFIQLLAPFFLFSLSAKRSMNSKTLALLIIYIIYLIVAAFNPKNMTVFHGILGIICHLGFWLAIFTYLSSRQLLHIEKLSKLVFFILIIEFILIIVQYRLPPGHFLNQYAAEATSGYATINDKVRVTGTFSYISGFSSLVIFAGFFFWGLMIKNSKKWAPYILLSFSIVACFLTGSRSTIIIFSFLAFCGFYSATKSSNIVRITVAAILFSIFFFAYISQISLVKTSITNFQYRLEGSVQSGEQSRRIWGPLNEIIDYRGKYPIFGVGLGATYQGANALWGESPFALEYGGYEEEPERIILEGGYILFMFKIFLFITLFYTWKIPKNISIPLLLLTFFYIPIIFNTYNAIYLILGIAFVDRMYYLKALNQNKLNPRNSSEKQLFT